MNSEQLLSEHYYGVVDSTEAVSRLRRFILNLAVRGRLVRQDSDDEPAKELMLRIGNEKQKLIRSGAINEQKAYSGQMVETNFLLPDSWEWMALGDVFLYDAGIKTNPKSLDASYWLLELEDIEKDTGRLLKRVKVSERKAKSTKSEFQIEDILYGKLRPYLNKVLIADQDGYSTTEIVSLRPYLPLCSDYCALALRRQDFVSYVTRLGQGTKMPRLRTEDAKVAAFPLPPLAEQHRIVAKVGELMTRCDQLEETFKERENYRKRFTKASFASLTEFGLETEEFEKRSGFIVKNFDSLTVDVDQISSLRQIILDLAVQGKLVCQDCSDEPARELFDTFTKERSARIENGEIRNFRSILPIDSPPFSLPDSWEWLPLGETGHVFTGNSTNASTKDQLKDTRDGYPYIMTKDVGYGLDVLNYENGLKVSTACTKFKVVRPFAVVICAEGGSAGRKLGITNQPICFGNKLIANETWKSISPQYLLFVYMSSYFYHEFENRKSGVISGISIGKFQQIPFPLPPYAEQLRIVCAVNKFMSHCDKMEADLTMSFNIRGKLLSSLLQLP